MNGNDINAAMKNKPTNALNPGGDAPATQSSTESNMMDNARNMADQARDTLQNAASAGAETLNRAKESVGNLAHTASEAAHYAAHRAEDATMAIGGALESTGHYLKEDGLRHIGSDLTEVIRRNPVPALLMGVGLGFLLAQAARRN